MGRGTRRPDVSPIHEALFGTRSLPAGRRRDTLDEYLRLVRASLPVLPYDGEAADWHAHQRARLVAEGRTPSFADGQIAAVAHTHGLTVVTANVRDFSVFAGVDVVSWLEG